VEFTCSTNPEHSPCRFSLNGVRPVSSPAADYTESELDLNEYCIRRRHSTYFVRAIGNSMTDIGLYSGDLMVVDKAEKPRHGDIVIAEIEEFTVKRLLLTPALPCRR
jgi:DNA polymerase V